jgi:transposase InsO family protein
MDRMVKLGRVSRSGLYRWGSAEPVPDRDMELRDAIQRIAVEWPSYGRPRMTKELRRRGWVVNAKRVRRLMREDNLLCVRKRKFVVTTDSNHARKIYPNLARNMVLTSTDQLWVADITYIRLRDEFVFLAVILDACSRRVIGWALDRTLEDDLTLGALRMALARRVVESGLVHHSDRGSQYASTDYTDLLKGRHHHQHVTQGQPLGEGLCFTLHLLGTVRYDLVRGEAFGQLHALRFSRRVIAGMLKQTVVFVVAGVTAKQPVAIPYLYPLWRDLEDCCHLVHGQHACLA